MGFTLVEVFNYMDTSGQSQVVKIRFNSDTGAIQTADSGSGDIVSDTRDWSNEDIVTPYCNGSTFNRLLKSSTHPYADLTSEANSSACSVQPVPAPDSCDILITNIEVHDESSFKGNNGLVIISVSTSAVGNVLYSTDGISFSVANLRTGLAPGDYIAYAEDQAGCKTQKPFTINAFVGKSGCMDPSALNYDPTAQVDDGSCQYPSPSPDPSDIDMFNLYEKEDQFRLVIGGTARIIREPIGWDKVNLVLKRDNDTHGVDFDFSDGSVQLSFTEVSGRSIIDSEINNKGTDAQIKLQFGYVKGETFIIEYEGSLYFNTPFRRTYNSIDCTVKRTTLNDNIETRYETPVTLTDLKTIDGSVMPAMNGIVLPLHSKSIVQRYIQDKVYDSSQYFPGSFATPKRYEGHSFYLSPDLASAKVNEVQEPGTNGPGAYLEDPLVIDKFDWNLKSNGNFTIEIDLRTHTWFSLTNTAFGNGAEIRSWEYEWKLVRDRSGVKTSYAIGSKVNDSTRNKSIEFYWGGYLKTTIPLEKGDKLYLFGRFYFNGGGTWKMENISFAMDQTRIKIEGKTETDATTTNAFMIHEAVDRIIKSISDNKGYLKSDLLGRPDLGYAQTGAGAKTAISNGYQIRQFDIDNRPVIISLKDISESINSQLCTGSTYEVDAEGNTYYRLERFDYFYRDVEILTIDNPSDYYEEADLNSIYNEIEIGYSKYPEDDVTTLDEFNTKIQVITPIVSYKKKLSELCKLIFSGYAIELTRRKKFEETPSDSWKYDEDNFGFCVREEGANWVPEKDEPFNSVEQVISPETSYNLRRSPKRMLQAWAKLLNTGFVYKYGYELIKNTFYSKNGDLTTKFKESEPFPVGDPNRLVTQEKADVSLAEFDNFDLIFAPETINFKASLNINQINDIKRCHQNRDNSGRNYGYIRVKDNAGVYQVGYLTKMEYNPVSEMTTLILRKKYANLGNQFDCSDYSNWTFSQFEATTGLSPEIEQCKFNDFN